MDQTFEEIADHFCYLNIDQIKRIVKKLVEKDVLIKGNFNRTQLDRTQWYAFRNEKLFAIVRKCTMDKEESHNGSCGSALSTLYTDTITNTNTEGATPPSTPLCAPSIQKQAKKTKKPFKKDVGIERVHDLPGQKEFVKYFKKPLVSITEEQHEKLIEKHGDELVAEIYSYLANWHLSKAQSDPSAVTKHTDYYRILDWVVSAVKKRNPSDLSDEDIKTYVDRTISECKDRAHMRCVEMFAGSDRIEIYSNHPTANMPSTTILFNENGFKHQLDNALRKWCVK